METLQQKINLLEGGITGTPLDEDDITQTLQELAAGGMPAIPEEMLAFLRRYNGFLYDGRCIFGIDNKHHFLYDAEINCRKPLCCTYSHDSCRLCVRSAHRYSENRGKE